MLDVCALLFVNMEQRKDSSCAAGCKLQVQRKRVVATVSPKQSSDCVRKEHYSVSHSVRQSAAESRALKSLAEVEAG